MIKTNERWSIQSFDATLTDQWKLWLEKYHQHKKNFNPHHYFTLEEEGYQMRVILTTLFKNCTQAKKHCDIFCWENEDRMK